jgi:hypothetical protein
MKETYSFRIKNNHPVVPKYALLLGSNINLNGELDDDFIDIDLAESSHIELKRELLGSKQKIVELTIIPKTRINNCRIAICNRKACGMTSSRIIHLGRITELHVEKIEIVISSNLYFLVLLDPDEEVGIIMKTDSEI